MEIRSEKELDAAIALAKLSKTEQLLRQARGWTLPRPRQAIIQLSLATIGAVSLVRGLMSGDMAFQDVVPWLVLLYAMHLGQRINAIVELLEPDKPAETGSRRADSRPRI